MTNIENTKKRKRANITIGILSVGTIIGGCILYNQSQEPIPRDTAIAKAEKILSRNTNNEKINNISLQLEQTLKNIKNEKELKSIITETAENEYGSISIKGVDVYKNIYIDEVDYMFYPKEFKGEKVDKTTICRPEYETNIGSSFPNNSIFDTGTWYIDITSPISNGDTIVGEFTTKLNITSLHGMPMNVELGFDGEIMVAKPVIYLYPEQVTDVNVNLEYEGDLFVTYPDYNEEINGWNVTAYPDGKIINKEDNLEYSYLFWDGFSKKLNPTFDEGFIVKGSQTKEFLQMILPKMGLTPTEYNEFIVYWLPLMQNNEYNVISFLEDEYTDIAKLNITPKPDSMLRVFMAFKGVNKEEAKQIRGSLKEQEIKTFKRTGFSVIEWGGSEIK